MITKEQKEKWLIALRSGEYEQGRLWMEKDGKYCCLGVLNKACHLDLEVESVEIGYSTIEDMLGAKNMYKCITMNDVDNKSFSEIADWIQENIKT